MKKEMKNNKAKITPLGDRVLIKEESTKKEETTTKHGIIIPVTVSDDKGAKKGDVVAVGEGKYEDGKLVPVKVKKGDTVLFQWGDKVKIDDEEFYLVRENEILAIITE